MSTVLVTGGSGFIGGFCILQLLEQGHTVRTTIRNLAREGGRHNCVYSKMGRRQPPIEVLHQSKAQPE